MAVSESHTWGQIIGNLFQDCVREMLAGVATEFGLYLDYEHERVARNGNKRVGWKDKYGNTHFLDYVLERGGSEEQVGSPAAFIEAAWRNYTKHSKAKAQEIEGAVIPLCDTYSYMHPFRGAILSGDFTDSSLQQLRSREFKLVYVPTDDVVAAFKQFGIDAAFGEDTPEEELNNKIGAFRTLTDEQRESIKREIVASHKAEFDSFIADLRKTLSRQIEAVIVTAFHGRPAELTTVADAVAFISGYPEDRAGDAPVSKYHILVRYSNGDRVEAEYSNKTLAVTFLNGLP